MVSPDQCTNDNFCVTMPNVRDGISVTQAMLAEAFMTGILVWVVNAAWDRRCQDKHDSLPVKFGLAIIALALPGVSPRHPSTTMPLSFDTVF